MSGFRVDLEAFPTRANLDHEICLTSPEGQKRWFTAKGYTNAKTIANYWAAFLHVAEGLYKEPDGKIVTVSYRGDGEGTSNGS